MNWTANTPNWIQEYPEKWILSQEWLIAALSLCMQDILTNQEWQYEISIIMQWMPSDKEAKENWLWEQLTFLSKFMEESQWKITWSSSKTWIIFLNCTPEILDQIIHTGKVKWFSPRNLNDQKISYNQFN